MFRFALAVMFLVAASHVAYAAPARCMIVNATDRFLIFSSGKEHDQHVPSHRADLIVAAAFSATAPDGKTVLVTGTCKAADRIEIVVRNGKLEAIPLVLATGKAADATTPEVVAYMKRAYKIDLEPAKICMRHPAFAPELLVVGHVPEPGQCLLEDVLARDATGELVTVNEGGFGWPEPFVEPQVSRGGVDAERASLAWAKEVEWGVPPLETATDDFRSKYAPKFFAPRSSTHGDAVWVEAWSTDNLGCYAQIRRTCGKKFWSEDQIESFCVDEGNVTVRRADGGMFRNGKRLKASQ